MLREYGRHELLVVTDRLPGGPGTDAWHAGLGDLVTALSPILHTHEGAWVGWGEDAEDDGTAEEYSGAVRIPVPLSRREIAAAREGFANSTVWPLFHDRVIAPRFKRSWWEAYTRVNERIAEAAVAAAAHGAVIWVHGHQLLLVPQLVRERRPDVRIGFFCHSPFPPAGLFAQLPWRRAMLTGPLGADAIGFQRDSDVANFVESCVRLLGADPTAQGRIVGAYPASVDIARIESLAARAERAGEPERIREELGRPETVLLGIDRLDHSTGMLERLLAVEELLDEGELDPRTTRMVQIAVPSHEAMPGRCELRDEVERAVGRINGKFADLAGTTIHYHHRRLSADAVIAWYLAADALLATSLREGMNLAAKEYVAARRGRRGALVLSEFAGAADELTEALVVNPYDREAFTAGILDAVRMEPDTAFERIDTMADYLADNDAHAWARAFLADLGGVSGIGTPALSSTEATVSLRGRTR